jgi:hypothetical protein
MWATPAAPASGRHGKPLSLMVLEGARGRISEQTSRGSSVERDGAASSRTVRDVVAFNLAAASENKIHDDVIG